LAVEHLNVKKALDTFASYWDVFDEKLAPAAFPERATMLRLNRARAALKHNGTMPSRLDLDSFVETTKRFFREMPPLVFGFGLDSVSMIEFVVAPAAREHLKLAQGHLEVGALQAGFTEAGSALSELLTDFEARNRDVGTSSLGSMYSAGVYDKMAGVVEELSETVTLLSYGLDMRRLARFRRLTPHVTRMMSGNLVVSWGRNASTQTDDLEFCIQFVLETALKIQEF
jgi:hypothetical protein